MNYELITPMKVYTEIYDLREFTPWEGAVDTWKNICDKNLGEDFIQAFDAVCLSDGISENGLNDFLWFQPKKAYRLAGLDDDGNWKEDDEDKESE